MNDAWDFQMRCDICGQIVKCIRTLEQIGTTHSPWHKFRTKIIERSNPERCQGACED